MLDKLILPKAKVWLQSPDCNVKSVIDYIEKAGYLREPQREAIEVYLFLKLAGQNRPLWRLFCEGFFASAEDLSKFNINQTAREVLERDGAARSLFFWARAQDASGKRPGSLENYLINNVQHLDCGSIIKSFFYGVEYTDYLFSLPMGAGKTYLMAALLYLDLYFANNEPENPLFAHNFLVLIPSGMKSSILPSLKTIERFEPHWVIPEPAAGNLKRLIKFEVLDQPRTAKRSNKARNPNAQKLAQHQPFDSLMGLVAVVNAEKVILDRLELTQQLELVEKTDDEKDKLANELRNLIGKIPNLQIHIDEVHHATDSDVKLRQVVNNWSRGGTINSVLGYSGTPYFSEKFEVTSDVKIESSQITNTVYYYPLTRAIKQFLKKPTVKPISELNSLEIVERGVAEFLTEYGMKTYAGGTTAKLAIYCGTIERLEEEIYPFLTGKMEVPAEDILKFHKGNKAHKIDPKAALEFASLDTPLSHKRIVLLVQIGKEGWDCRSLTGVILSQKGDCPTNMVLQTSCRPLRQVVKGDYETAGVWLNADNAKLLDKQLK
ncbi:MAG: DEAD/DEAH box helicase family protein, partial [Acidobacteria bacterium]|nr:DEAD/DEAH box helicase family protein [Acidobacteriota bacterium]MCA1640934.1 DEAD/DEAH box helicase family protein [Acidobacteriota bacterium]